MLFRSILLTMIAFAAPIKKTTPKETVPKTVVQNTFTYPKVTAPGNRQAGTHR
jgi:hypothetical protein